MVFLVQHPRDWLLKNILHSSVWAPLYRVGLACGVPPGRPLYRQAGGTHLQYATLSPEFNVIPAMLGWTGKTPAAARVGSSAALMIRVARSPQLRALFPTNLDCWVVGFFFFLQIFFFFFPREMKFCQTSLDFYGRLRWWTPLHSPANLTNGECSSAIKALSSVPVNSQSSCNRTNHWFCGCFPPNVRCPEQLIKWVLSLINALLTYREPNK